MARDPLDPGTALVPGVGQLVGYGRKSKGDQELALQQDALKRAGCDRIYLEQVSRAGPRRQRKGAVELEKALATLRAGDTFVVWRLDRLGGSVTDLIRIVEELKAKGVQFLSLTESIDTRTAAGNMFFQLCAVFAEYERRLLIERTNAGLDAARKRGRYGGRPRALTPEQVHEIRVLLRDPHVTAAAVARQYSVSKTTIYKYLNQEDRNSQRRGEHHENL